MATADLVRLETLLADITFQIRNLNQLATEPESVLKRTATELHAAELSTQLETIIEELRTLNSTLESQFRTSQADFESEKKAFEATKKAHEEWYEEQKETVAKAQAKLTDDNAALKIEREEFERAKAAQETRANENADQQREHDRQQDAPAIGSTLFQDLFKALDSDERVFEETRSRTRVLHKNLGNATYQPGPAVVRQALSEAETAQVEKNMADIELDIKERSAELLRHQAARQAENE